MSSSILLISDLHLEDSRPDITQALLAFLTSNKAQCSALYILGDLFEVWIGDDEQSELANIVAAALLEFSSAGSSIQLMHGNRDFLLGADYAKQCGASLISDPTEIETDYGPVLLLHGDSLCSDDTDYIEFRNMVRQESWQQEFLAQSLDKRRAFAQKARERSRMATSTKDNSIMDVNQSEVENLLIKAEKVTMIHGHTHRPAVHDFALKLSTGSTSKARRVVLGDWDQRGWYVEVTAEGIKLENFPFTLEE
ncbi:MAG: UDP-2,3-diacylglucosamine diphosphatase [SAR86 cluster bacterium]|uniref:UDP-2,3-diacylglucosamine hydrolase n=1 Tax=SAR86 cluster bacterium TaxID=2030880 RepID=A0A2A5BAS9_9GAMM|nr:MAG: UDP-2,3-diacylglucosamine diphosphatase [SAR86 cluster bacterium]